MESNVDSTISSSDRLNSNISRFMFEVEIIEEWIDPFDSIVLKLLTIVIYIVELLASFIMLAFVSYETGGDAGHYRTVINQLLSYGYAGVRDLHFCCDGCGKS